MDTRWRLLAPRWLRALPADLAAVVGHVCLTVLAVFLPVVSQTPLRVAVGLPFVLFTPGYAFVAALFPEAGTPPDQTSHESPTEQPADPGERRGIDGIERVALSFGTAIAIVPLVGLVLNFTPFGIRLVPIVASVGAFTLACTAVATHRRQQLPADERFRVPYRAWIDTARRELFQPDSRADAALNVLLVVSLLLATASVAYAVAVPKHGEAFSELYLLTEDDGGDLVADEYPTEFVAGESQPVVVGVGNHEHETTSYTVVAKLQRVRIANNSSTVLEERELRRFQTGEIADNETWLATHDVTPTMTGERLRLLYLLYRGDPPPDPTIENAYRENNLFVNVSETATPSPSQEARRATPEL